DVIDLDRRETEAGQPRRRARFADEARQVVAGGTVAVAAEVDAREDDLAVPLLDPTRDFGEHRGRAAAARGTTDEGDDAEVAREAAAVLHLDEGADAVEAGVGLDAADRAHVPGD